MLSRAYVVPEDYFQQWWCYSHIEDDDDEFCSYVAGYRFAVKTADVRKMLNLPSEKDVVGKSTFDPIPKNSELISDFIKLGYNEDLTTLSSFRRKCLPPVWYTLFSIINTCLSGKSSSLDQASTNIRIVFHGIAHNKHYDYAKLLFEEMRSAIAKKSTFSYIPFQRFFQMFIKAAMKSLDCIPSLENAPHVHFFTMDNLRPPSSKQVFPNSSPLPKELLAYVNPRNEVLVSYLESLNQQEPADSSPDSSQREVERVIRGLGESGDDVQGGEHHQIEERTLKRLRKGSKSQKRIEEERTQEKVLTSCDLPITGRATTMTIVPHSLEDSIETAEPKANLENPQGHSPASEKAGVSSTLMEQHTYNPASPHLEELVVEKEGSMSPLHHFVHIESTEPNRSQDDLSIHTCTSPKDFPKQSVSHFVKTTIGDPDLDILGLVGSPGEVNIKKASLKESFVDSDAVASTGQAAQDAVLKTVPSVGTGFVTYSSEFQQFKDLCSNEFEKIHKDILELTKHTKSGEEARVAKVLEKLQSEVVKKSELNTFQSEITKSFSEVASAVSNLKVNLSFSEENLATKSDVKIILDQLTQVQTYQLSLDDRLKALESQSTSLKRKQVEHEEGDAPLEGEKKRRKTSEMVIEEGLVEKRSEPEQVMPEKMISEQLSKEVEPMMMEINSEMYCDDGYETEKVDFDYDDVVEEYKVPDVEVEMDSNEEMLYEYLTQEGVIGEPRNLSDVIMFDEGEAEAENFGNSCKDLIVWKPLVIISEVTCNYEVECFEDEEESIEENLHRELVIWKSNVVNSEVVVAVQRWFSEIKECIIQNSGFLSCLWYEVYIERLSIFRDFLMQEAKEEFINLSLDHLTEDYETIMDELWLEFTKEVCVQFREPIKIKKIKFDLLDTPIIDKVFQKDIFYLEGTGEMEVFPEIMNSSLYRMNLRNATLESFISDQWTEEYREKVSDYISKHGAFNVSYSVLFKRILKISTEEKEGMQVKLIGAERRDGTLVEFSEFEIYFLRLQDKLTLLNYCVNKEEIDLGKEIKRILGIYLRNLVCHDFQLALEMKKSRVNLLEPINLSFQDWVQKVFIIPELGFVYHTNNIFRTFIISDIPKYSDSTLNWLIDSLFFTPGAQMYKDEIIFLIKERINFRNFMRKVFPIAHAEVNHIREADYLLSSPYDFEIHGRKQFVPFEILEVEDAVKGKRKLSEERSSEAAPKRISLMKEAEESARKETELKISEEKIISEEKQVVQKSIEEHELTLFLEHFHSEMFMETEQRFNFIDCWLKKSFGWKMWYSRMLDDLKQPMHKVRSDVLIKKVIDADLKSKKNFTYSRFIVERMDGQKSMFSEADFQNMYIRDLIKVYNSINPFHDKIAKFRKTFPTLRDGLYRLFIWAVKTDFQVAYVLKKEKVHLSKPNVFLDGVEKVKKGTLLVHPPGFVCKLKDQRLFIRYEEIHKCCNGTLMAIYERLKKKQTRKPKKMKEEDWKEYLNLAINFCDRIEKLLEYRRIILNDVQKILIEWKYDLSF